MRRKVTLAILGALALSLPFAGSAQAAPQLSFIEVDRSPETVHRNDEYVGYTVTLKNSGDQPTTDPVQLEVSLPAGIQLVNGSGSGWSCDTTALTCVRSGVVADDAELPPLTLDAWVFPVAPDEVTAQFTASGGGSPEVNASDSFSFAAAKPFGVNNLTAGACSAPPVQVTVYSCTEAEEHGAVPYTAAGGHPFAASSSFEMPTRLNPSGGESAVESLRDLFMELPAGFLGNPEAVPAMCTVAKVRESTESVNLCPESAAVGGLGATLPEVPSERQPIYRVVPEEGYAAAFAVRPSEAVEVTIVIRVRVRSNGDYGVSAIAPVPPQQPELLEIRYATLCGYGAYTPVTGTGAHTPVFGGCKYPGAPDANKKPFLTMQTACPGSEVETEAVADSYQNPGAQREGFPLLSDPAWKVATAKSPPIEGCNALEFEPEFEGRPTTSLADAPSGLEFALEVPQEGLIDGEALATPHLKDTTVVLPEGMAVNPSAASGLEACTPEQIGLLTPVGQLPARFSVNPAECPDAAKLGDVRVSTPLLAKPLRGGLYLATQQRNPFGSLVALYLAIHDPETGIVAKLPGRVTLDQRTGQVTTTFAENPQVPVDEITVSVAGGPRASLRTPSTCGQKATQATFVPWSAPQSGPPKQLDDVFAISSAPGGALCPTAAGQLPHAPRLSAGTVNPTAGAFSPFVLRLARDDGSQEINGLQATMPPGLTGRLAGVPYCGEAQIARAVSRDKPGEGTAERDDPSCPAASQVGVVDVSAGAGPLPYRTSGKAYLAGPYKGAPLSIVAITPAVAGPFDLGAVVVRNALHVNPITAQVSVSSDPIPTIIEGVPLDVRLINVRIDRPDFTLNPTSCEPSSVSASVSSPLALTPLSNRFQVGDCARLGFKPRTNIRLFGGIHRAKYQGVRAVVRPRPGDANISGATVRFPSSAFVAQEHLQNICTRVQWAADACPPNSVYGTALAYSPLLDEPLRGKLHLRSSNNLLPDLVADLRGPAHQPIRVEVAVKNDSVKGALRNTVQTAPDAPVTYFRMQVFGGKKALIVNSRNICKGKNLGRAIFRAHNGRRSTQAVPVRNAKCAKFRKAQKRKIAKRKQRRNAQRQKGNK